MGGRQRRGMRRRTAQDKERSRRHSFRPVQPAPRYTMHDEVGSIENRIVTANLANSMALRLSRLQSYSAAQGPHDLRLSVPLLDLPSQGPSLGVDCRAHLLPLMSPHPPKKTKASSFDLDRLTWDSVLGPFPATVHHPLIATSHERRLVLAPHTPPQHAALPTPLFSIGCSFESPLIRPKLPARGGLRNGPHAPSGCPKGRAARAEGERGSAVRTGPAPPGLSPTTPLRVAGGASSLLCRLAQAGDDVVGWWGGRHGPIAVLRSRAPCPRGQQPGTEWGHLRVGLQAPAMLVSSTTHVA